MYLKTFCLFIMLYCSVHAESVPPSPYQEFHKNLVSQKYTFKLIRVNSNLYGYEIYSANKLFIRQVTIPGMPGNKGFQRNADAEKIAKLIITKLSKGIIPPTVDKKELDHLRIKY